MHLYPMTNSNRTISSELRSIIMNRLKYLDCRVFRSKNPRLGSLPQDLGRDSGHQQCHAALEFADMCYYSQDRKSSLMPPKLLDF